LTVLAFPETAARNGAYAHDTIDVFLVEDDGYFRHGLRELLVAHDPRLRIVGDSASAEAAVALIPDLAPDVVLMDIHLAEMSGTEAIRSLAAISPLVHVLVLSGSAEDSDVLEAILAGARGYLLKAAPIGEIVEAIRAASRGGSVLSPAVASQLFDHVRAIGPPGGPNPRGAANLTPRELDVLRLLSTGLENSQIADELVISPRTARNHVSSILAKLHMENRIQAAVYAVKHGLA
jgi:two-component system NarL family response regulator